MHGFEGHNEGSFFAGFDRSGMLRCGFSGINTATARGPFADLRSEKTEERQLSAADGFLLDAPGVSRLGGVPPSPNRDTASRSRLA
jgi:hypothetical protein